MKNQATADSDYKFILDIAVDLKNDARLRGNIPTFGLHDISRSREKFLADIKEISIGNNDRILIGVHGSQDGARFVFKDQNEDTITDQYLAGLIKSILPSELTKINIDLVCCWGGIQMPTEDDSLVIRLHDILREHNLLSTISFYFSTVSVNSSLQIMSDILEKDGKLLKLDKNQKGFVIGRGQITTDTMRSDYPWLQASINEDGDISFPGFKYGSATQEAQNIKQLIYLISTRQLIYKGIRQQIKKACHGLISDNWIYEIINWSDGNDPLVFTIGDTSGPPHTWSCKSLSDEKMAELQKFITGKLQQIDLYDIQITNLLNTGSGHNIALTSSLFHAAIQQNKHLMLGHSNTPKEAGGR